MFGLCGFLSVSVVVLGVCRGWGFVVGFVGGCSYAAAWRVVVVVLVKTSLGVGLAGFVLHDVIINWDLRFT